VLENTVLFPVHSDVDDDGACLDNRESYSETWDDLRFIQPISSATYHEINGRAVVNLRPQSTSIVTTDWSACWNGGFNIRGGGILSTHSACQSNN